MSTQQMEPVTVTYVTSSNKDKKNNELNVPLVEMPDIPSTANNTNYKRYRNAFISMLQDPSQSCIDAACIIIRFFYCTCVRVTCNINLWIGTHILLLLLTITHSYSIYYGKTLIDILNINCQDEYDGIGQQYYDCQFQNKLSKDFTFSFVSIFVYCFIGYSSICLLINFITLFGIYKLIPLFLLFQVICLLIKTLIDVIWFIYIDELLMLFVILWYLWIARIFYRVYRWAKYYKNGSLDDPDSIYPE